MVGQTRAGIIAQIGQLTTPKITEGRSVDLAGAMRNFVSGFNQGKGWRDDKLNAQKKEAYIDALKGGNQDEINQAWSAYDPQGFANYMNQQAQRAEDRQWKLEDQQFQRDLLRDKLNGEFGLAKYKAGLNGGSTNAQRNVQAMIDAGYSPQDAWAMYYGGQNPSLNLANLGQKGQEAYDKALGGDVAKNYAEDLNTYNNLQASLPELEKMVDELAALAPKATHTKAGRVTDVIQRELLDRVTEGDKAASLYETKVNQNLLPLLRQTFGAAFTERDREALQKTLGDPFAHPDIKNETLKSFINNKRGEIEAKSRKLQSYSQPSLKQFNETPQYQEGMIAEDANGNRLIFRGGQWQQM